jgi:putative PIN family toxin of toxin-antitoxin system
MVSRKQRIPVVFDTNVFVRALKTRSTGSPNRKLVRLWLIEKRLQLIVSAELVEEYLGVFRDILRMDDSLIDAWRNRFEYDSRSTLVNLGRRFSESRDPDDNLLLATAAAGKVTFLVTNDKDLLDLPREFLRTLRFDVLPPQRCLHRLTS